LNLAPADGDKSISYPHAKKAQTACSAASRLSRLTVSPAHSVRSVPPALFAAPPRRLVRLAVAAARATLLAAARFFVHRRPSAALGLFLRHTAILVAFLDVLGFTFLFVRVCPFIPSRHCSFPLPVCVHSSAEPCH